jgi:hypothetical protein
MVFALGYVFLSQLSHAQTGPLLLAPLNLTAMV